MEKKIILMCGSDLSVKGGMVSVAKNYLDYCKWEEFELCYIPTHIYGSRLKCVFFLQRHI